MWEVPQNNHHNYLVACNKAATNAIEFAQFKRNPHYTTILEHVDCEQGMQYYEYIKDWDLELLPLFIENDWVGGALLMKTPIGNISPTTLRYIKNALEIQREFGELSSIVEIGGGYGGLCKTLSCIGFTDYTIVDLKEPLALAKKYLQNFSLAINIAEPIPEIEADLVISNYALSELDEKTQTEYFDKIISKCNKAYITYNTTYKPYYQEFLRMCGDIFDIHSYDEAVNNGGTVLIMRKK